MELNSGRFITLAYTLAELTEILEVKKHLYTFPMYQAWSLILASCDCQFFPVGHSHTTNLGFVLAKLNRNVLKHHWCNNVSLIYRMYKPSWNAER